MLAASKSYDSEKSGTLTARDRSSLMHTKKELGVPRHERRVDEPLKDSFPASDTTWGLEIGHPSTRTHIARQWSRTTAAKISQAIRNDQKAVSRGTLINVQGEPTA
jgi:hypothetical protein